MSKQISGAEFSLSKIFSSDFEYIIPPYQRPYAWGVEQAEELFDDLFDFYSTDELENDYFLGSIVLIKKESEPRAEVIDGQQRLTTLTILLAILANTMEIERKNLLRKYILEPGNEFEGIKPKPRLTLRERDDQFFHQYIRSFKFNELSQLDDKTLENESQLNIKRNSQLFQDKIKDKFKNDPNNINKFVSFLVTRCFLVTVSTSNQQSAFRVFSVMNSRGLDLQTTDILKADIIGKFKENDRQTYNNRWEKMETELGRNEFNDLFSYIRMIYAKAKAKRTLLEEFREYVIDKKEITPEELIENILEPYAKSLTIVKKSCYEAVTKSEEVNSYLKWLNKIDNSDWIPIAIYFLKDKKNEPSYVEWFFQRLERLAAFMHISAYNINQRIARYNEVISELDNKDHSFASPITAIELKEEEKEKMITTLNSDIYEMTARRRNYLILRLDSFISDKSASYDYKVLTIEHVLPQTVEPSSEWAITWPNEKDRKDWVHKLANLVPLSRSLNAKAQNFDFEKKKKAYFLEDETSSYALTTQVLAEEIKKWTLSEVKERQDKLIKVLKKQWMLDPEK